MEGFAGLVTAALFLAAFQERFIEHFLAGVDVLKPFLPALALLLGLVMAFAFGLDLISPALALSGQSLGGVGSSVAGVAGKAMTGILLGGGSQFLHDAVKTYLPSSGGK